MREDQKKNFDENINNIDERPNKNANQDSDTVSEKYSKNTSSNTSSLETAMNKTSDKPAFNGHSSKKNKIFFFIKIFIIFIPILIFIYIGVRVYRAYTYSSTYSIDFNSQNFKNTDLPLYINEDSNDIKFGSAVVDNNLKYYDLKGSPLNFVFQPEEYLWNKQINFSSIIKDTNDWQIRFYCEECSNKDNAIFDWQPLYYGKLNDYNVIAKYNDVNVYSKVIAPDEKSNTLNEFLANNLQNGDSLEIKDEVLPLSEIANPDVDFISGKSTEINYTLRGSHKFYLYLDKQFEMEIIKTDLNSYNGTDEVKVVLEDLDGNVVFENIIEDDGISIKDQASFSRPIRKSFVSKIPKTGIYKLFLSNIESSKEDWLIKYMKINTNKIVIDGKNLILDPVTLYTEKNENFDLDLYVWKKKSIQNITLDGTYGYQEIPMSAKDLGVHKKINLDPGYFLINLKGYQYLDGGWFSFSPDQFFRPFIYDTSRLDNQKIILSKYNFVKVDGSGTSKVEKAFSSKDISEIANNKRYTIQLRNIDLAKNYETKQNLLKNGSYYLDTFENIELWGSVNPKVYNLSKDNLTSWLSEVLPKGSSLQYDEQLELDQMNFINQEEPIGYIGSNEPSNDLYFSLRGSHSFYVYLNQNLKANIDVEDRNIQEGADNVFINLVDANNNIVCESSMSDDGNISGDNNSSMNYATISCDSLNPGVYLLKIDGVKDLSTGISNDFLIKKLSINSNKIVLANKIYTEETTIVYTNNMFDRGITAISYQDKAQEIAIDGGENKKIVFRNEDSGKEKNDIISKGNNKLTLTGKYIMLKGTNLAFKKDNWFEPEVISIIDSEKTDFALINNAGSSVSYIKQIDLEIQ